MEIMSLLDNLHPMPLHWGLFLFHLGIPGGLWSFLHLINSSLYVAALLDLGDGCPLSPPPPPPLNPFCQALLLFTTYEFFFLAIFF
jgi:hypothetical protein